MFFAPASQRNIEKPPNAIRTQKWKNENEWYGKKFKFFKFKQKIIFEKN